jgi:hypothetical protein
MNRRHFVQVSIVIASSLLAGCDSPAPTSAGVTDPNALRGSGGLASELRPVSGFRAIEAGGAAKLEVSLDGPDALTIEAEDHVLPLLMSEVKNDTLILGPKAGASFVTTKPITYKVTTGGVKAIKLTDSISARISEIKTGGRVSLYLGDSSRATVGSLDADEVSVELHGSSTLTIMGGLATSQTVTIADSSSYGAEKLETATGQVTASDSAKAVVNVANQLKATARDSASIRYVGSPKIDKQTADSGRVEPR